MSPSAYNLNGFRAEGALGSGGELAHAAPSPMIEHQLNSPADIGKAHQFFQPGAQAGQIGNAALGQASIGNAAIGQATVGNAALGQATVGNAAIGQAAAGNAAIGNAALGQVAVAPGGDGGSLALKALQMAQNQVSPLIQLIMRMPGHIGLMSNFFEALAGFFTHHAQLIGGLDPTLLASAHGDLGAQFAHAAPLGEHMPLDLHILPHDAPFLHNLSLHTGLDKISLGGSEHGFDLSYINDHLLPHSDLNVSGTLDAAKPQYEGLSFNDPHGEIISGPSMSHASPAHHLADDKSLVLEKGFSAGHSNPALAANPSATTATSTATSTVPGAHLSQPSLALNSSPPTALPTSLNVGSSAFAAPPAASAAVGNIGTVDSGSLSGLTNSSGIDNSSFGPSGAVSDKLGGQQLLAMNKPDVDVSSHPGSEYGANFIKSQSAGGATEGLKAKELSLDSFKPGHKVADTSAAGHHEASHGNALEKLHKQSHEVAAKHTTLAHQAHKAVTAAKPTTSAAGSKGLSVTSEPKIASSTGAEASPEAQPAGSDAGADATADAGVDYKIQAGDNLWNIAKDKLGDATKWNEIFKLNSDSIGANPSMIHPGVTLHMPGQSLAHHATEASKYVVKSGDNLWNISKNNLGDATKWGEVYKLNHEIIGANPGMIRPGTELTLPGGPDASGQLADASGVSAAPGLDAGSTATAAAAPEQVAQGVAPESTAPAAFGHPEGVSADAPISAHPQPIAGSHLPNQSLETTMPPSGAANAAETPAAAGPGAAGAATLPVTNTSQFGVPNGGASNPENSSVVSSSVGNDLASFLSRKK
jgi:nucleoid-associated protein YgaU